MRGICKLAGMSIGLTTAQVASFDDVLDMHSGASAGLHVELEVYWTTEISSLNALRMAQAHAGHLSKGHQGRRMKSRV